MYNLPPLKGNKWFTADNKLTEDTRLTNLGCVLNELDIPVNIRKGMSADETYKVLKSTKAINGLSAGAKYLDSWFTISFDEMVVYVLGNEHEVYIGDEYGAGVEQGVIRFIKSIAPKGTDHHLFINGLANMWTQYSDDESICCAVRVFNGGGANCFDPMGIDPLYFAVLNNTLFIRLHDEGTIDTPYFRKMVSLIDDIVEDKYTYDRVVLEYNPYDTHPETGIELDTISQSVLSFVNDVLIPDLKVPVTLAT